MPKSAFSNNSTPLASINDFDVAEIGSTIAPLAKDELMMRLVDGSAETVFRSEDVAGTAYDFVEITLNNPTAFGQVVEVGVIGANLWINASIKNNTDPAINGPAGHALLNGANDTAMWVRFFCESVADGWSVGHFGGVSIVNNVINVINTGVEWVAGNDVEYVYSDIGTGANELRAFFSLQTGGDPEVNPDSAQGSANWIWVNTGDPTFNPVIAALGYYTDRSNVIHMDIFYEAVAGGDQTQAPSGDTDANWRRISTGTVSPEGGGTTSPEGGGGMITTIGSVSGVASNPASRNIDFSGIAYQAGDVAILNISCDALEASHAFNFSETGWEQHFDVTVDATTARTMQILQYKKVLSASEPVTVITNTQTGAANEQWAFVAEVKRGVDPVNTLDVAYDASHLVQGIDNSRPTNASITTVTPNAEVNFLHGWQMATEISAIVLPASPVGLVAGTPQLLNSNVRFAHATLQDAGPAGLVTPSEWTHTHSAEQDFWCITYALRSIP